MSSQGLELPVQGRGSDSSSVITTVNTRDSWDTQLSSSSSSTSLSSVASLPEKTPGLIDISDNLVQAGRPTTNHIHPTVIKDMLQTYYYSSGLDKNGPDALEWAAGKPIVDRFAQLSRELAATGVNPNQPPPVLHCPQSMRESIKVYRQTHHLNQEGPPDWEWAAGKPIQDRFS